MNNPKILVTGGMGYIGSHTVVELVNVGYDPIIIDNLSNSNIEVLEGIKEITGKAIAFFHQDICDISALNTVFEKNKIEGIIHFAAYKAVGESVAEPLKYYYNNILGLHNILECTKNYDVPNLIFSSSCTVYGQPDTLPVTEDSAIQEANSPYGNTKIIGEQIILDYINSKASNLAAINLRYFNPIGAHDSALIGELPNGIPNNLMPYITQTAIGLRETLSVFGNNYDTRDGTAIRDYIHVVDIAKAHVVSLQRLVDCRQVSNPEIFNLGTGQGSTVLEVIESFEKTTGVKVNYKFVDRRSGDVEAVYADTTKANAILGWSTKLSLDDMTASAWKWEQKIANK